MDYIDMANTTLDNMKDFLKEPTREELDEFKKWLEELKIPVEQAKSLTIKQLAQSKSKKLNENVKNIKRTLSEIFEGHNYITDSPKENFFLSLSDVCDRLESLEDWKGKDEQYLEKYTGAYSMPRCEIDQLQMKASYGDASRLLKGMEKDFCAQRNADVVVFGKERSNDLVSKVKSQASSSLEKLNNISNQLSQNKEAFEKQADQLKREDKGLE